MNNALKNLTDSVYDLQRLANDADNFLSHERYDSEGGWKDAVADSFLNYTDAVKRRIVDLMSALGGLQRVSDGLNAQSDAHEAELARLQKELAGL